MEIFKVAESDEEIEEIKKTIKIDESLLKDAYDYTKLSLYSSLVDSYTKLKEFEKAIGICWGCMKIAEKINDENWISIFSFKLGLIYYRAKNNYSEGEILLRKAIKINENFFDAHNNLGILLQDLKRYEEAEKEYGKAIEINPRYEYAHNNIGTLLAELKLYEEAEKEYGKAIEINPRYEYAHNNIGTLLAELKRYEEAEKEYGKAIELNPDDANLRYNMGIFYEHNVDGIRYGKGFKINDAIKEYTKALNLNPEYINANMNLAELYFIKKDYEKSLELAENALKISKTPYNKLISKFLILINLITVERSYDLDEFIKYLNESRGYEVTYVFEGIKNAIKGIGCEDKVLDLIDKIEELKGHKESKEILKMQAGSKAYKEWAVSDNDVYDELFKD